MTKEELQEIADMYGLYTEQDVKNRLSCELLRIGARNEELEIENEELRNNGFTVSAMTEQQLKVVLEKGEQLEKENAELKEKLEHRNCLDCSNHDSNIKLLKAKEHIKQLLDCLKQDTNDSQTNYYVCQYMDKAEQFLKELKK